MHCNAEFYYVGKIRIGRVAVATRDFESYALQRRENLTYWYWAPVEAERRRNTVVGGECALPSALLVISYFGFRFTNVYNKLGPITFCCRGRDVEAFCRLLMAGDRRRICFITYTSPSKC